MALARGRETACFVAIVDCRTVDDIAAEVAGALGIAPGTEPAATVGRALQDLPDLWLVLDNAEQAVDPLAEVLCQWLGAAPGWKAIVTSRERLRLAQEVCHPLPPLALPAQSEPTAAVELLLARVRDTWQDFVPSDSELSLAAELVRRLDGLPLAIELAAPQVDLMGLESVLERLSDRLDLLDQGRRGAPARQATLRGSLDWSWALLNEGLQQALSACGVFRGRFDLAAAGAVLPGNARRTLMALRDRSLVRRLAPGVFGLYEGIAAYALERLRQDPREARIRARHRDHYLAWGEARWAEIADGADARILGSARGNLLVVFESALEQGDGNTALRVSVVLAPLLLRAGPVSLLLALLDAGLTLPVEAGPVRSRARQALGLALQRTGALGRVQDAFQGALDDADSPAIRGRILKDMGVFHHQQRRLEEALKCYEDALPLLEEAGDVRGAGVARGNVGALLHDQGAFEGAATRYRAAILSFRRLGDARVEGIFQGNLGVLLHEQGQLDQARTALEAALTLLERGGDRRFVAITLGNLGAVAQDQGLLDEALERHRSCLEHLDVVEDAHTRALALARLGAALAEVDRVQEAEQVLRQAERVVASGDDATAAAVVALAWAFVDLARGAEEDVTRCLDEARAARVGDRPLLEVSDEARLALRRLDRLRAARLEGKALRVAPGGVAFQAPGGSWRDVSRNRMLPRILEALVQAHAHRSSLDLDELFEAGWPGERAMPAAAANRVYVALSKLRSQGLEGMLLRDEQGWRLDPDRPVVRVNRGLTQA
jgi:predicted ATPase/Tfp pilus assembly protein PilF